MSPAPAPLGAFSAVWFCYFAAIGLYNPYAPLWFRDLGLSTLAIGALASAVSWTRVVAPYGWGWFGDRSGGGGQGVRWAAGLSLAAALALWWWGSAALAPAFAVLLFLANGGVVPLSEAALSRHLQRQGGLLDFARYGRVRLWGSLGFVASVMGSGLLFERVGIGHFPLLVLLAFAGLWLATLAMPGATAGSADGTPAPSVLRVLRAPAVAGFFAGVALTVLAHTAQYAFFSLYLSERGHGEGVVGLAWGIAVSIEIAFFWWQGRLFERMTPFGWLQLAAAAAAVRFALTAAFGDVLAVLLAAQTLHGLTFAAQHAACIAMLNRFFPGRLRGRGQALYSVLGYGIPGVLGGLGGGWLGDRFGFAAVFWAASVAALVSWAVLRWVARIPTPKQIDA